MVRKSLDNVMRNIDLAKSRVGAERPRRTRSTRVREERDPVEEDARESAASTMRHERALIERWVANAHAKFLSDLGDLFEELLENMDEITSGVATKLQLTAQSLERASENLSNGRRRRGSAVEEVIESDTFDYMDPLTDETQDAHVMEAIKNAKPMKGQDRASLDPIPREALYDFGDE